MGDKKRSLNFYMLAAHLTPKDASLWKVLVTWSLEEGNKGQARYFLSKAITADPEDINLRFHRASLFLELGDYLKSAESYEQISCLCPENVEVLHTATQLYNKCGQPERAVGILEHYLRNHPKNADLSLVNLLATLYIERNEHSKALEHIEQAEKVYCAGKEVPFYLIVKSGICHVHLGNVEKAEALFSNLHQVNIQDHPQLIFELGHSLVSHRHYDLALKYYLMLERNDQVNTGYLHLKIAECYLSLNKRPQSMEYLYKALEKLENTVDARLTLSSLLLEEKKDDEAISVLSHKKEAEAEAESGPDCGSSGTKPWWLDGKIKLKLSQIYKDKGMLERFVDEIFPLVHETLFLQTVQQNMKARKRLSKRVLFERIKILDDNHTDTLFNKFRPVATASDLSRASRAKKLLEKKATMKEAKRAAALSAGIEWKSDDSDDESPQPAPQEPPLPNLLKDAENHHLIVDLCKGLLSLQRYLEGLQIITLSLKLASGSLSPETKEVLRTLGAQIAYSIADPAHGWEYARYVVNQYPYSPAAWNCYYKVISKLENRCKHDKFKQQMRGKHRDCVPLILISGHHWTMARHFQDAAKDYLQAYKLMPNNPLINLCAGTALLNLALGLRLRNKHQCMAQGLAFLYNNLRLCKSSQEALYNIARAYHHVGLVTLAAANYEKVLAMRENDYPIPKLPNENPDPIDSRKSGYCDVRREAAYNLHLIYRKSGAFDLARQVLKDHCAV